VPTRIDLNLWTDPSLGHANTMAAPAASNVPGTRYKIAAVTGTELMAVEPSLAPDALSARARQLR
jgi:hypothetical protein